MVENLGKSILLVIEVVRHLSRAAVEVPEQWPEPQMAHESVAVVEEVFGPLLLPVGAAHCLQRPSPGPTLFVTDSCWFAFQPA